MSTPPLYGPPKVGGDALAYCTRCKMELAHVIIAMMSGRPIKVICKTCKSEHRYKGSATSTRGSRAAAGLRKPSVPRVTVRASEYFDQKLAEMKGVSMTPYKTQSLFAKGSVIQHPQFGIGIVEEVRSGKISVLFREGEKVLVHGLGTTASA